MPAAFTAVHLDGLPRCAPLRPGAGEPLAGRDDELAAGDDDGIEQEEVSLVLSGAARFTIDDTEQFDARAGEAFRSSR
ncbi:MAG: cupin domain-containing protein [Patulibacter minatonensis]